MSQWGPMAWPCAVKAMQRSCVTTTKEPNWPLDLSEPSARVPGPATLGKAILEGGPCAVQIRRLADAEAVGEQVAHWLLASRLADPSRPVGLATGRTMEPVYGALARQFAQRSAAERQRVRRQWCSFNLDEYVGLSPKDPRSFAATMAAQLVTPLQLDAESVLLPRGDGVILRPLRPCVMPPCWRAREVWGSRSSASAPMAMLVSTNPLWSRGGLPLRRSHRQHPKRQCFCLWGRFGPGARSGHQPWPQ